MTTNIYKNEHLWPRLKRMMKGLDGELEQLLIDALSYISPIQLAEYIDAVEKFNKGPVHIMKSEPGEFLISGEEKVVHWYNLRKDLKLFPSYFEATGQIGISNEQAYPLLLRLQETNKYDFTNTSDGISLLIQTAELCHEKGIDLFAEYPRIYGLLDLSLEDGEQSRALGIFNLSLAAGFSVEQGVTTVRNIYEHAWSSGYGMMGLYDELNTLKTHSLDPNQLFEALQIITKSRGSYQLLAEGLHLAASKTGAAGGAALLQGVIDAGDNLAKLNGGDRNLPKVLQNEDGLSPIEAAASACFDDNSTTQLQRVDLTPEEYFPEINTTKLIHGVMPYRLKRSLSLGIADLKKQDRGDLSEGMFVFDQQTETWYSLGGRTKLAGAGRVRHEFFTYDISQLSDAPIVVHVHPTGGETFLTPPREALSHTCMQTRSTKFFAAVPSGTDFKVLASLAEEAKNPFPLHGMIVTSSGLTFFRAPNDLEKVREFGENFQSLKDGVLLNFDVERYLARGLFAESDEAFARRMVAVVNEQLPNGFEIAIKPYEEAFMPEPQTPAKRRRERLPARDI